jgi:hypothetical protein
MIKLKDEGFEVKRLERLRKLREVRRPNAKLRPRIKIDYSILPEKEKAIKRKSCLKQSKIRQKIVTLLRQHNIVLYDKLRNDAKKFYGWD